MQKSSSPSARQIRWLETLLDYTLEIEHIAGKEKVAADALSRLSLLANCEQPTFQWNSLETVFFPLAPRFPVSSWWPDYLADQDIRDHYFIPGTDELSETQNFHHGRLWKGDKIIVPARRYLDVIKRHHDLLPAGHWGIARTSALIRRKHLIPNLKRRVQAIVSTCDIC